ncbi:SdrD B-like domain-containing protein, partial [Brevibacterium sp.]|uniref:SdrD B-like domain-containing protein n=1 Tax=Brevibacterium sp. TaxID=1701 RepID=UPI0025C35047
MTAAPAAAVTQNGYVFNDAWTMTGDNVTTQYSPTNGGASYHSAETLLPSRLGGVEVEASFAENSDRSPSTSVFGNGTNQGAYRATAANFLGAPNPADLPALGLYTNGSAGCGGALGTAAHQNQNGACDVGQLTLNFSKPVTDMVLDISGLGGFVWATPANSNGNSGARGSFNTTDWSLATEGVTFASVSGGAVNLSADATSLTVDDLNTWTNCNENPQQQPGTRQASPRTASAGCGSVILKGTYSEVTFDISAHATPFSAYSTADYGTGAAYFVNDGSRFDGVNGLNTTLSERNLANDRTDSQNADLQRVSLRLPENGRIGDRVWSDTNGDGIQDEGEPGIADVVIELLDADGNPVLDADGNPITTTTDTDGNYVFEDLPYGEYKVRVSAPEGMVPTTSGAGDDRAADSDIDANGESGVVSIDSANPENSDTDAGFVLAPEATDDESHGNTIGDPVTVPVLDNDSEGLVPGTVNITDPNGDPVKELVVPGEGTWTVNEDGSITFTPEDGFEGQPTDISY